jgi:hypothetical protein
MGLIDKMMGPRRDDPRVVEYLAAEAAAADDDSEYYAAQARLDAAADRLSSTTLAQLAREARR